MPRQEAQEDVEIAHRAQLAGEPFDLGLEGVPRAVERLVEDAQRGARAAEGDPQLVDVLDVLVAAQAVGAAHEGLELLEEDAAARLGHRVVRQDQARPGRRAVVDPHGADAARHQGVPQLRPLQRRRRVGLRRRAGHQQVDPLAVVHHPHQVRPLDARGVEAVRQPHERGDAQRERSALPVAGLTDQWAEAGGPAPHRPVAGADRPQRLLDDAILGAGQPGEGVGECAPPPRRCRRVLAVGAVVCVEGGHHLEQGPPGLRQAVDVAGLGKELFTERSHALGVRLIEVECLGQALELGS